MDSVTWDGIQLPSLKQLKVRLVSGLLSFGFSCNVCRERHPSRGWNQVGGITEHNSLFSLAMKAPSSMGHVLQAGKEKPPSKSISAWGDLPPSFPAKSILRYKWDFQLIPALVQCEERQSSAAFISYIHLDYSVCVCVKHSWSLDGLSLAEHLEQTGNLNKQVNPHCDDEGLHVSFHLAL